MITHISFFESCICLSVRQSSPWHYLAVWHIVYQETSKDCWGTMSSRCSSLGSVFGLLMKLRRPHSPVVVKSCLRPRCFEPFCCLSCCRAWISRTYSCSKIWGWRLRKSLFPRKHFGCWRGWALSATTESMASAQTLPRAPKIRGYSYRCRHHWGLHFQLNRIFYHCVRHKQLIVSGQSYWGWHVSCSHWCADMEADPHLTSSSPFLDSASNSHYLVRGIHMWSSIFVCYWQSRLA